MDIGKIYEINHIRKGKFAIKVLENSGEWLEVEIVSGIGKAMMSYNVALPGDIISIRKSHVSSFKQVNEAD